MPLNIQFQGTVYDKDAVAFSSDEVNYQVYFHKVNSNSSPSKWGSVHKTQYGQYSFNLGDNDLLTPSGKASAGDIVVVCFWTPNTSQRTDSNLIQWGLFVTTLTDDDVYVQDAQIKDAFRPNCNFTTSGPYRVQMDTYVNDAGSNDEHAWTFSGKEHKQVPSLYGQDMFSGMNSLPSNSIDIDWDDGSSHDTADPGSSTSHIYSQAGTYNISVVLTNVPGLTCGQVLPVQIRWRVPTCDFVADNWNPNPQGTNGLGEKVTFTNTTTDPDNRADVDGWYWDWEISDNGPYGNFTENHNHVSKTFSPDHEWHNPGDFNVTLTLHWYDGFGWLTQTKSYQVHQRTWTVSNGLDWTPQPVILNQVTTFTPNITGDVSYITGVDYDFDNGEDVRIGLAYDEQFTKTFTVAKVHTVNQKINYHDGFHSTSKDEDYTILVQTSADFTWEDYGCGLLFKDASVVGQTPVSYYQWEVVSAGMCAVVDSHKGADYNQFFYSWPFIDNFSVTLTIEDHGGNVSSKTKSFTVTECPGGVIVSGGGGGVFIERPRMDILKVTSKTGEDERKVKIKVKPVKSQ